MFVKIQRDKELIKVDSAPARIVRVGPDATLLEVRYALMSDAIVKGRIVRSTVLSRSVTRRGVVDAFAAGDADVAGLVDRIVSLMPDAKTAAKAQNALVIASHERVLGRAPTVTLGRHVEHVQAAELRRRSDTTAVLRTPRIARAVSDAKVGREELFEALVLHGVDPSDVSTARTRQGAYGVSNGLIGRNDQARPAALQHHLDVLMAGGADVSTSDEVEVDSRVAVLAPASSSTTVYDDIISLPALRLVEEGRPVDHLIIRVELLDDSGSTIDAVTLGFDLARHLAIFATPRVAPSVNIVRASAHAALHIRPGDAATQRVRVLRRIVPCVGLSEQGYSLVGEYAVASSGSVTVSVPLVTSSVTLYRVVPLGAAGRACAEYTNVVLRPAKPVPNKHVSLTVIAVPAGLLIEVRDVPSRVRAIEVLRRDITACDRAPVVVGVPIFIDAKQRALSHVSIIDRGLKPEHTYEYSCRLTYVDGRRESAGLVYTDYSPVREGRAMTSITELSVDSSSGEPDVAFTLETTVIDTDMDTVKHVMAMQGVTPSFIDDITRERSKLKDLITHRIVRVDLMQGVSEDFGIVASSRFIDSSHRVQSGVRPLVEGKKYRYEVEALLRVPETMFDELVTTKTDAVTRRQHQVRPAKHMHPVTLARGTVVTPNTLRTRHAVGAFGHGRIGSTASVEVTLDRSTAHVTDVTASLFDSRTVIVTWHVQGDPSTFDHFIIMRVVSGDRFPVGKCHVDFPHSNFQFLHTPDKADEAPASYIVVPVTSDYDLGEESSSDELEVRR